MSGEGEVVRDLVSPQTLKGFQDLLPEDVLPRDQVIAKIKKVYELYGFLPIDTPALEHLSTLVGAGGEETNKQLFRLKSPEDEPIAMRFDLTVPFARLIAQYPEKIKLPFRRYHIGPVFRADDPGPGRFRQFTQFDIDAAGSDSVAVDSEIVAAMCEVMREIGLHNEGSILEYQVKINNRKLVDALLEGCEIHDTAIIKHVLRVVDKLQKVGLENVRLELSEKGRIDDSGDKIRGVGLSASVIERIVGFITVEQQSRIGIVEALTDQLPKSEKTAEALTEMKEMAACLEALGVPEADAVFDPSLARGLDYYTGPVFEAVLPVAPRVGSVMGGGRYDGLVSRFLETRVPATGASIGLDRLIAGLKMANKISTRATTVNVLVIAMSGVPHPELLKVNRELRAAGIPTTIYFGQTKTSIKDQFAYANALGIPVAVVIGSDEIEKGTVSIKNLLAGLQQRENMDREEFRKAARAGQVTCDRSELLSVVQRFIGEAGLA